MLRTTLLPGSALTAGGGHSSASGLEVNSSIGQPAAMVITGGQFSLIGGFINGTVENVLLGDVNLDGVVDLLDVAPFVDLLTSGEFQTEADINQDGTVDLLDVAPFVDLIAN